MKKATHEEVTAWVKREQAKKRICNCGCGNVIEIKVWHRWYGISKYLDGHQNIGRKRSDVTKRKISKAHKGKRKSEEHIENLRIATTGSRHWNYGKHRSDETKRKISKGHMGLIIPHTPEQNEKIRIAATLMWADPKRRRKITAALPRGASHSQWKGGISFEPYCYKFNEGFKERIRNRFNRCCFLCGITEGKNKKRLCVHHVNYDKNCLCDGTTCAFVPLCQRCHSKVNFNREHWESTITKRLEEEGYIN